MDIFARAGEIDKAMAIFERVRLNAVKVNILIRGLGKEDMVDRATEIVKNILHGPHVNPTAETFN